MYSIMNNPMTACGCFECIVMLVPEANGVMVVSREDPSMTPAGMTFSTLAGMAGGGLQTQGVMGVGKYYLTSPKFISADGGFKRVVWMSSVLKQTMAAEFQAVAEREGDPDLISKIADETICTDVDGLLAYLEAVRPPGADDGSDLLSKNGVAGARPWRRPPAETHDRNTLGSRCDAHRRADLQAGRVRPGSGGADARAG